MDIKEGLTWYLERIIPWDQAATEERGIAARMQRELGRERPGGIPGGQPALPDPALPFPEPTMEAGTSSTTKLRP